MQFTILVVLVLIWTVDLVAAFVAPRATPHVTSSSNSDLRLLSSLTCSQRRHSFHLMSMLGDEDTNDYDDEEILMKLHLSIKDNVSVGEALDRVSKFCQSFPFAAVLPVQPLQYLPTSDGGVNVRFLRKKTKEKRSLDGGIRFFLSEDRDGIDVVAKRNSEGQTIPKMFAEKLVVQSFMKQITGEENDETIVPPTDVVAIESVFHKWL